MKFWDIRMSEKAPKTVEIYIYTNIREFDYDDNYKLIPAETSAEMFRQKLEAVGEFDNINIYINSLGGSVKEGLAIYNQLKRHPTKKTAYIDGFCFSAATLIALACDDIIMPKNAVMLIHGASSMIYGNAKQLRKQAEFLDTLTEAAKSIYTAHKTEALTDEALQQMLDEEAVISAEDCVKYGFATAYADYDIDLEKAKEQLRAAKDEKQAEAQSSQTTAAFEKVFDMLNKISIEMQKPVERRPEPVLTSTPNQSINTLAEMAMSFRKSITFKGEKQ